MAEKSSQQLEDFKAGKKVKKKMLLVNSCRFVVMWPAKAGVIVEVLALRFCKHATQAALIHVSIRC